MPYESRHIVTSIEEPRAAQPRFHPTRPAKILDDVDELCLSGPIECSTFLALATYGADGSVDVSPKGDPAGFVRVLDPKTLAIPGRLGNHRLDSFENILQTGLVFLVPNRNEAVRMTGSAQIVPDPEFLASMAIKSHMPEFAIVVRVEQTFHHSGKAIIRSRLWPQEAASVEGLPTYAKALKAHSKVDMDIEVLASHMKFNDKKNVSTMSDEDRDALEPAQQGQRRGVR